ncbi:hypothetical protein [Weissella minor]|uniref:hypothetical protein n=1 Tax=Weissella minor TaxID=1620 RepID=UPI003AF2EFAB
MSLNKNSDLKVRGGYSNIGESMSSFDSKEDSEKKHKEELKRIIAERDAMAAELEATKRKKRTKVKLQVYIDADLNQLLLEKTKNCSRQSGGKSAYINHLLRTAIIDNNELH